MLSQLQHSPPVSTLNARTYHAIHRRPRHLNVVASLWVARPENGLGIIIESDNTQFWTVVVGEVLVQRIGRAVALVLGILCLGEMQLGHRPGIDSRGHMAHISTEVAHGKGQRTNMVVLFSDLIRWCSDPPDPVVELELNQRFQTVCARHRRVAEPPQNGIG